MRIAIDARFYGPIGKGLGRYTQQLIKQLEIIDTVNEYSVLLRQANWDSYQPANPRFRKVLADYQWYSLAEQIHIPRILRQLNSDIVHFPHFNVPLLYRRPFVVTVHDLIITSFPTQRATTLGPLLYKIKRTGYTAVIRHAVRRARKVLTVSQYVKDDLSRHFHLLPEAIAVTYEAANPVSPAVEHSTTLARYELHQPYLLYVGNAYPHKNLERLIEAFAQLRARQPSLELVLVGRPDYFFERLQSFVKQHGLDSAVRFPGYVPDEDLPALYRGASLYVFPSLAEGFGLPPLEAMSYGLPVAAANASCLPEILGDAAAYFDPQSVSSMVSCLQSLLDDSEQRDLYRRRGLARVATFSWKRMAEQTLAVYQHSINASTAKTTL